MKVSRVRLALLLSAFLTCSTVAHASSFTLSLLPAGGSVAGVPGSTIGWGYSIINNSVTDWLMLTNLSADPFLHATPDASLFLYPIVAPGTSVTVPHDASTLQGLFQITWDVTAPVGFTNAGLFVVEGEFWDGDPFAGGSFVALAAGQSAAYSATVTASVHEPSTLLLASAGALALLRRRRRGRA
jgi:hypothetical protein